MVKLQLKLVCTVKYIVELYHAAGVCNQGDRVFFPRRSSETDISSQGRRYSTPIPIRTCQEHQPTFILSQRFISQNAATEKRSGAPVQLFP